MTEERQRAGGDIYLLETFIFWPRRHTQEATVRKAEKRKTVLGGVREDPSKEAGPLVPDSLEAPCQGRDRSRQCCSLNLLVFRGELKGRAPKVGYICLKHLNLIWQQTEPSFKLLKSASSCPLQSFFLFFLKSGPGTAQGTPGVQPVLLAACGTGRAAPGP